MIYYDGNVEYKSRWHCYWWKFKYDVENLDWGAIKFGVALGVVTGLLTWVILQK